MKRARQPSPKSEHHPAEMNPGSAAAPFTASDLPMGDQGRIYHLQVKPGQIAPDIILVGDPWRAEFIGSNLLRDVEYTCEHRGLVTVTGTFPATGEKATIISPLRTTVATSGIGTPSLEIVVGELVALNEIDFETRTRKTEYPRLHVIRVGSSGGLQASTELGTPIITTYSIGLDNTGLYYEAPYPDPVCERIESELVHIFDNSMSKNSRFYGKIRPYVTRAEPILVNALLEASDSLGVPAKAGLTVSCPGFFAPQGRDVYLLKPSISDLDKTFSAYDPGLEGQRVENMEMEASFLLHFLGGQGYWAGVICTAIANRQLNTFTAHYKEAMKDAAKVALLALANLRNRYPDVQIR